MKKFYELLDVSESSSQEEIKKSYRKLSLKYHPDKNNNNPEAIDKFQQINEAYETLGNPEKRNQYDSLNKNPFSCINHDFGDNIEDLLNNLIFGARGMPFMGASDMQDIHGNFPGIRIMKFGPGLGTEENPGIRFFQNAAPIYMNQKPEIITKNVNINIDKVLTGCSIPLDIERWILENGIKVFEKMTIYITIEKGIDNNEIILLHNQGHVINNSCKGDIKIFIQIINNTEFERNGLDLIIHKKISLKESLCGFQFELKYINDKIYTIHNHSGNIITPEYQKIIPNMGLTRENHVGNLIIHFHIEFPLSLSPEKIALLTDIL